MRLVIIAACVLTTTNAMAGTPGELQHDVDCMQLADKMDQVTRVVRACSDAAYVRQNIDEADAVCAAVLPFSKKVWAEFERIAPTPDAKLSAVCPSAAAAGQRHLAALKWSNAWMGWRLSKKNGLPKPFTIAVPKAD